MKVSRQDGQATIPVRDAAERVALKAAVTEALADPYGLPHEEVDVWLEKIAACNFDAPMPVPRRLM